MEFKKVRAVYIGAIEDADSHHGWSYDIEIHEHEGLVTVHRPGLNWQEQTLTKEAFDELWQIKVPKTEPGPFARFLMMVKYFLS